jgi:VanZ family protein
MDAVCGVMAVAVIIFASVMLPAKWEQLRTGHWALEHFFAYFAAASVVSLGWRRPFVVAAGLAVIAAPLLEALQSLEPTHSANFLSVVSGGSGAFTAALVVSAIASTVRRRSRDGQPGGETSSTTSRPHQRGVTGSESIQD